MRAFRSSAPDHDLVCLVTNSLSVNRRIRAEVVVHQPCQHLTPQPSSGMLSGLRFDTPRVLTDGYEQGKIGVVDTSGEVTEVPMAEPPDKSQAAVVRSAQRLR